MKVNISDLYCFIGKREVEIEELQYNYELLAKSHLTLMKKLQELGVYDEYGKELINQTKTSGYIQKVDK